MATIFENSNLYKVIILSTEDIKRWRRAAACDHCESHPMASGFYVAAHNLLLCPQCYEEWCETASGKRPEQIEQEEKHLSLAIVLLNAGARFSGKSRN